MKVSREQVAEHRTRILAAAARLFRLRGFDEVTVAEVMKDAGLTHGAFYGYFPSKEALIAEAVRQARTAKCEWLHVDFDDHLRGFYFDACGFKSTNAGLIGLHSPRQES